MSLTDVLTELIQSVPMESYVNNPEFAGEPLTITLGVNEFMDLAVALNGYAELGLTPWADTILDKMFDQGVPMPVPVAQTRGIVADEGFDSYLNGLSV